jgi:uncharacterized protein YfiM (DUF2279 family)
MKGLFVTFELGDNFDRAIVEKIAGEARGLFEGMPGVRQKVFTLDEKRRRAVNFYIWESEAAARAFFTDELIDRVTGLYGVPPTLDYVDIATIVDNT